jgi:fucose 4-O-acetylase-like acetyltransferase
LPTVRQAELDIVRGFAIAFVVAVHIGVSSYWNDVLRAAALPAFFAVSGYWFKSPGTAADWKSWIAGRVRSLLVPYWTAGVLSWLLWMVTMFTGEVRQADFVWYKPLVGLLYGNDPGGWLGLNGPLWFLICLFSAQMLLGMLHLAMRRANRWSRGAACAALGLAGWGIGQRTFLPWGADLALAALPFLYAGLLAREHRLPEKLKPAGLPALACAAVFALTALNNSSDMDFRSYGNVVFFYVSGISGAFVLLVLAKLIGRARSLSALFSWWGRESLAILIFHYGFVFVALKYVDKSGFHDTLPGFVYWLLGIFVPILASSVIRRAPLLRLLLLGGRMGSGAGAAGRSAARSEAEPRISPQSGGSSY